MPVIPWMHNIVEVVMWMITGNVNKPLQGFVLWNDFIGSLLFVTGSAFVEDSGALFNCRLTNDHRLVTNFSKFLRRKLTAMVSANASNLYTSHLKLL
jgi:hypothetical protein